MPFDGGVCVLDESGLFIRKVEAIVFALPVAMFSPGITFTGILPLGPFG